MSLKSKAKRICMVAIAYYPTDPRIRREAESLESAGYEVDILCCRLKKTDLKTEKYGNITVHRIIMTSYQDTQLKFILQSVLFISISPACIFEISITSSINLRRFSLLSLIKLFSLTFSSNDMS